MRAFIMAGVRSRATKPAVSVWNAGFLFMVSHVSKGAAGAVVAKGRVQTAPSPADAARQGRGLDRRAEGQHENAACEPLRHFVLCPVRSAGR